MTGLDKIISQIENDAQKTADDIMEQAKRESDDILKEAQLKADDIIKSISDETARSINELDKRSQSAAQLKKKQNILAAKQEIIDGIIEKAKERLVELDDAEYFDTLIKIAKKYVLPQEGEIILSKKDTARMPENFEKLLNDSISDSSAKLTIAKQTQETNGGFILNYGGMEVNCTFNALFASAKEEMQDKVREMLF